MNIRHAASTTATRTASAAKPDSHGRRRGRPEAGDADGRGAESRPMARHAPDGQGDREQRIRELAYDHYVQRGCIDGHALDDWLKAEAQLP